MSEKTFAETVAAIDPNLVAVTPITRQDDGSRWLQIDIPNGWDDVKRLTKKVLVCDGRTYSFRSWNSDTLKAHFRETTDVAYVIPRRLRK